MFDPQFEGWAIVELLGHRSLRGLAREVELFGALEEGDLNETLARGDTWP